MHSLMFKPDLFQAYFAFSPSLWWDDQVMIKRAEQFFKETTILESFLYLNMGKESKKTTQVINAFKSIVDKNKPINFEFVTDTFEDESHVTTPVIGQYKAYRALFRDWWIAVKRRFHSDTVNSKVSYLTSFSSFKDSSAKPLPAST